VKLSDSRVDVDALHRVGPTSCGTLPIGYVTGSAALTCSPPVLPASWCDPRCPQAEARNPLHVNSHRWCAGTVLPATLPPHRFVHFPCAVPFSPPLCCQHRHRCPVHSHRNRVQLPIRRARPRTYRDDASEHH